METYGFTSYGCVNVFTGLCQSLCSRRTHARTQKRCVLIMKITRCKLSSKIHLFHLELGNLWEGWMRTRYTVIYSRSPKMDAVIFLHQWPKRNLIKKKNSWFCTWQTYVSLNLCCTLPSDFHWAMFVVLMKYKCSVTSYCRSSFRCSRENWSIFLTHNKSNLLRASWALLQSLVAAQYMSDIIH